MKRATEYASSGWRFPDRLLDEEKPPAGESYWAAYPFTDPDAAYGELVVRLDGALSEYVARLQFTLADGQVFLGSIVFEPDNARTPIDDALTVRALKGLRLGDVIARAEQWQLAIIDRFKDSEAPWAWKSWEPPTEGTLPDPKERSTYDLAGWALRQEAMRWAEAFMKRRKRGGRAGVPDVLYARISHRRVVAEREAPGDAIGYMVRTWPGERTDEFISESAAVAKVHRAKLKGMHVEVDGEIRLTERALELLGPEVNA